MVPHLSRTIALVVKNWQMDESAQLSHIVTRSYKNWCTWMGYVHLWIDFQVMMLTTEARGRCALHLWESVSLENSSCNKYTPTILFGLERNQLLALSNWSKSQLFLSLCIDIQLQLEGNAEALTYWERYASLSFAFAK